VDILHTDSEHFGTQVPLGHTDFYIGYNSLTYGSDQAGCIDPVCDHGRAWQLVRASLRHTDSCWATVQCMDTETYTHLLFNPIPPMIPLPHTVATLKGCSAITNRPHFGYFYDGKKPGIYGVQLTRHEDPLCFKCLDENDCAVGEFCDLTSPAHECTPRTCDGSKLYNDIQL
jgi:hypothetical protein